MRNKIDILYIIIVITMAFSLGLFMESILDSFSSPSSGQAVVDPNQAAACSYSFEDLLDAIEQVESKGNANAVGDNGNAVGAYQIWKIYVDDVNRILGEDIFAYDDRYSKVRSACMVTVYVQHYCGIAGWDGEFRPTQMDRFEAMARIHNGGPQGYRKESTESYWLKVLAELKK